MSDANDRPVSKTRITMDMAGAATHGRFGYRPKAAAPSAKVTMTPPPVAPKGAGGGSKK